MSKQVKCMKCGKLRSNKTRNDKPLCRACWVQEQHEGRKQRYEKHLCINCGNKISDSSYRDGRKLCRPCADKLDTQKREAIRQQKIALRNKENPLFCKWCGKPMQHQTHYENIVRVTCSKECARKWAQKATVDARETKEHLEERIIAFIKSQGVYTSLKQIREKLKISDKLVYKRGISIPDLNYRAGVSKKPVGNNKTYEELFEGYKNLLLQNKGITINEAARELDVSVDYFCKIGLKVSDVRKAIGIHTISSKTRDEVISIVVPFIQQQGMYTPFSVIRKQFKLDYKCAFQNNNLTITEVNEIAGYVNPKQSYWERYTYKELKNIFKEVISQKTFEGLKYKSKLRFDFYIPSHKVLIEVNGDQHYNKNDIYYTEDNNIRYSLKKEYVRNHPELKLFEIAVTPISTFNERLQQLIYNIQGLHE